MRHALSCKTVDQYYRALGCPISKSYFLYNIFYITMPEPSRTPVCKQWQCGNSEKNYGDFDCLSEASSKETCYHLYHSREVDNTARHGVAIALSEPGKTLGVIVFLC